MDFVAINNSLSSVTKVSGVSPRWLFPVNATAPAGYKLTATLLVIDSSLEQNLLISPRWPFRALKQNEIHVTGSLLRALNIYPDSGNTIQLSIDLSSVFNIPIQNVNLDVPAGAQNVTLPIGALSLLPIAQQKAIIAALNLSNVKINYSFNWLANASSTFTIPPIQSVPASSLGVNPQTAFTINFAPLGKLLECFVSIESHFLD